MAPFPPLTPPPPEAPGARVPMRTRSLVSDEVVERPDAAEIVLAKLRGMIAAGTQENDTILGTIGVLEAFSTHSYAFTEQHMDLLGRLAGLAEAAWARGSGAEAPLSQDPLTPGLLTPDLLTPTALTPDPPAPSRLTKDSPAGTTLPAEAPAENSRLADASLALTRVGEALAAGLRGNLRAERRWRYLTIAG